MIIQRKLLTLFVACGLIVFSACTDLYHPRVDALEGQLVVEALLTDQSSFHEVKLHRSVPFGQDFDRQFVSGATVRITSSLGEEFWFAEREPGVYKSVIHIKGVPGESYQLSITTADGDVYMTDPQVMMPPFDASKTMANKGMEYVYVPSHVSENVYEYEIDGVNMYLNLDSEGNHSYYRFQSNLVLQHVITYGGGPVPETFDYCWVRRNVSPFLDTNLGQLRTTGLVSPQQIAFIPSEGTSMIYFGFPKLPYSNVRILENRMHSLNEDAYRFYHSLEQQLGDEGRFFDPIAAEVEGNIYNKANPLDKALGLFEVSSVSVNFFNVRSPINEDIQVLLMEDVTHIPPSSCLYEEFPDFWVH